VVVNRARSCFLAARTAMLGHVDHSPTRARHPYRELQQILRLEQVEPWVGIAKGGRVRNVAPARVIKPHGARI
jgi:hypothetical protein